MHLKSKKVEVKEIHVFLWEPLVSCSLSFFLAAVEEEALLDSTGMLEDISRTST